uniref:Uncharacterized protein n=1 Tax=Steinernema glaseri TaxID=37863 RepID=A0A1I7Z0M8_9BILA
MQTEDVTGSTNSTSATSPSLTLQVMSGAVAFQWGADVTKDLPLDAFAIQLKPPPETSQPFDAHAIPDTAVTLASEPIRSSPYFNSWIIGLFILGPLNTHPRSGLRAT